MIQGHFRKFINNPKCQKVQCIAAFMKVCIGQFAFVFPLPGHLLNSYVRVDDIEPANFKRIAEF